MFDPLRAELRLSGDPKSFRIKEISGGEKTVLSETPDHWQWSVTPLRRGQHSLKIESVIRIEGNSSFPSKTIVLTEQDVATIEGSAAYTLESASSEQLFFFFFVLMLPIFGFVAWFISSFYYRKQYLLTITETSKVREEDL